MSNQYPHHQEMDAVTKNLMEYSEYYDSTPMETIREYTFGAIHALDTDAKYKEDYDDFYSLNDLEEAVAIKNFCIKYQKRYRDNFSNGRKRA